MVSDDNLLELYSQLHQESADRANQNQMLITVTYNSPENWIAYMMDRMNSIGEIKNAMEEYFRLLFAVEPNHEKAKMRSYQMMNKIAKMLMKHSHESFSTNKFKLYPTRRFSAEPIIWQAGTRYATPGYAVMLSTDPSNPYAGRYYLFGLAWYPENKLEQLYDEMEDITQSAPNAYIAKSKESVERFRCKVSFYPAASILNNQYDFLSWHNQIASKGLWLQRMKDAANSIDIPTYWESPEKNTHLLCTKDQVLVHVVLTPHTTAKNKPSLL